MGKTKTKAKKGSYIWTGDLSRIVPLGNDYCYVRDDTGKTLHIKKTSEEFVVLARHLDEVMNGKITRELTELGWSDQLEKMKDV